MGKVEGEEEKRERWKKREEGGGRRRRERMELSLLGAPWQPAQNAQCAPSSGDIEHGAGTRGTRTFTRSWSGTPPPQDLLLPTGVQALGSGGNTAAQHMALSTPTSRTAGGGWWWRRAGKERVLMAGGLVPAPRTQHPAPSNTCRDFCSPIRRPGQGEGQDHRRVATCGESLREGSCPLLRATGRGRQD